MPPTAWEAQQELEERRKFLPAAEYTQLAEQIAISHRPSRWHKTLSLGMLAPALALRYYGYLGLLCALLTAPELQGQPLLWSADLSRCDPYYILPLLLLAVTAVHFVLLRRSPPPPEDEPTSPWRTQVTLLVAAGVGAIAPMGLLYYWVIETVLVAPILPTLIAVIAAPIVVLFSKLRG